MFNEVDKANATFSGTYVMVQNGAQSAFPFYGKYDPAGYMIGWVVSFHNKTTNNHQVGVWSGYTIYEGGYPKHYFYMTKLIATQVFVDPKPEKDVFRL